MSYDPNGTFRWAHQYNAEGYGIALSGSNVVVSGQFAGTTTLGGANLTANGGGWDGFLAAYATSDGTFQWNDPRRNSPKN